jgi:hydrogenase nickel incorporation protein HypB
MTIKTIQQSASAVESIGCANRERLERAGVAAVNIIGSAGCGKTSLIRATLQCLAGSVRVGVITADPDSRRDAERLAGLADQVVHVNTGHGRCLDAALFGEALDKLDLDRLDLLLIENVSSLIGPTDHDLGETKRVAVFSVAAGDDKLQKYQDVVRWADVVLLNKIDLLASFTFDMGFFRRRLRRINPRVALFELSVRGGEGIDCWAGWLRWESHRGRR